MFRPNISQLIDRLEGIKKLHGDLEIVGFNEKLDVDLEDVDAEVNGDSGMKVVLLTVEKAE